MERSREKLKDLLRGAAWGPDLVDTIFAISDRVGRSTKVAASSAAGSVTTVVNQVAASVAWNRVTDKPTTFPPSTHTHSQYLTQETDPTVPVHVKAITQTDIGNWNAAPATTLPPSADAIGTDSGGGAVKRDVTISESPPSGPPTATDWIWFVVDPL